MKIVFAGTPAFGLPCLEALASSSHELQAVYTQPDRPAGRGLKLQASTIKAWAEAHHIPVYQPLNFKEEADVQALAALQPDIMVVIAYGLILPQSVLGLPRLGCINVHASLLPRYRGASPIQQALLEGDMQTGVTIMQMEAGLDTGPMLTRASCDIGMDNAQELHDRLSQLAVTPLLHTLEELAKGQANPCLQNNDLATYAPKINKADAAINWHLSADQIDRQIRAYNPWPISFTEAGDQRLRIYKASIVRKEHTHQPGTIISIDNKGMLVAAGNDALLIEYLQWPGAKAMSVRDWFQPERHKSLINLILQ